MTNDELVEKVSIEYGLSVDKAQKLVTLLQQSTEDRLAEARTLTLIEARDHLNKLADEYQTRFGGNHDATRAYYKAAKEIHLLLTKKVLAEKGLTIIDNTEGMPNA